MSTFVVVLGVLVVAGVLGLGEYLAMAGDVLIWLSLCAADRGARPADLETSRRTLGESSSRLSGLDAGGGDDEVGREAEQDPGDEEPDDEHRMAVLAVDREELPHDVEDRAAGER